MITERPVSDYLPLATSSGAVLTQYDMNTMAELGILKDKSIFSLTVPDRD